MSLNDAQRKRQKKVWFIAKNSAKNNFFASMFQGSHAGLKVLKGREFSKAFSRP